MKLALISIAAVTAALVAVAPASAVVYSADLGTITAASLPAFYNPSTQLAVGSDTFNITFTLLATTAVNASSFTSSPPPLVFTSGGIYAGTFTSTAPTSAALVPGSGSSSFTTTNGSNTMSLPMTYLTAGSYTISVSGNASAATSIGSSISFTAAPEPATWGLMVLGFGAIGGALRTSRRKVVFA